MLGSCFLKRLSGDKDFETFAFDKSDLDISDFNKVLDVFKRISPDFVINCAAYTAVDDCETNREEALKVNGDALEAIARACKSENAALVHFSTDYVFNGLIEGGYTESAQTDPINFYGQSKLRGEENIEKFMNDYYIIRTSWLFGEGGKNFVDTMISLGSDRDELSVVCDQVGSPTYVNDLCEAVLKYFLSPFLEELDKQHRRQFEDSVVEHKKVPFGIYHLSNSDTTCWYDFAVEIFKEAKVDVIVNKVTSAEFKTPAKRPKASILKNTKLDFNLRPWTEALRSYLDLTYFR
ncbi:dTDP-4-dehydrorhamnose reductase [Candidatus Peregrinibacteria bacterium]|nr:dTDP-4-dehydrorhamnose reductase [Candidatus Peregrinibacteria bacterium]